MARAVGGVVSGGGDELDHLLKISKQEKLVLVSLGGIASRLPMERWPRIDGVRWLVQRSWQVEHPDAIILETLPMGFSDLLASSDTLIIALRMTTTTRRFTVSPSDRASAR